MPLDYTDHHNMLYHPTAVGMHFTNEFCRGMLIQYAFHVNGAGGRSDKSRACPRGALLVQTQPS